MLFLVLPVRKPGELNKVMDEVMVVGVGRLKFRADKRVERDLSGAV